MASPQTDSGWSSKRQGHAVVELVNDLLNQSLGVDRSRIVSTGVSMGGAGTFEIAARHPQIWAAVVPVCGAAPSDARWAHRLSSKPVWIWHGANDVVMPVQYSDAAESALKLAGSTRVRYSRVEHAPAPTGWPHYTGHAHDAESQRRQREQGLVAALVTVSIHRHNRERRRQVLANAQS